MQPHPKHYVSQQAAKAYLKYEGFLPKEVDDMFLGGKIHIGKPPYKWDSDLLYSEHGYWYYQKKDKHIDEVV